MPKHLYTLPSGPTLPDPAGSPEGYPFLLEQGAGASLKQTMYVIKNGAYAKLGGSGSVGFGPLIPVVSGTPLLEIQADQDTSAGGAGYPSLPRGGSPEQTQVSSFDSIVPLQGLPVGSTYSKGWLLGQAYNSDVEFGDYALSFRLPFFDDPQGDAQASSMPSYRLTFDYQPPTISHQQETYIIGLQAESFDPSNVSRVATNYSERSNPDSSGRSRGGGGDDRFDGSMVWFNGSPYPGTYSITMPPGTNYFDFIAYQTQQSLEPPSGVANSPVYSGVISNISVELLQPGESAGALFVEESTGQIWIYDNSILKQHTTDADGQGDRGAGWYPITPVQLFDIRGYEFEHLSEYGSKYYIGQHLFSSATDIGGRPFGLAKQDRTPAPFHGVLAPVRPGATNLGLGFGFVDHFLDQLRATTNFPRSSVDNNTAITPPAAPYNLYTQTYGGNLNPGISYYYRYVCFDAFGGSVASAEASHLTAASSSFANLIGLTITPLLGTDHVKIYRGTASGNEVEIATITQAQLAQYNNIYYFQDDTPNPPVSSTPVPTVNTFATLFSYKGRLYSLADYARVSFDSTSSDVDIEVDFDYAFDFSLGDPIWSVRFRGTSDTDYFEFMVEPRAGTPAWTLQSVVAGTPTVLTSGTFTFIQPFTLAVKAVADQVLLRISDSTGRLHQVLLDDFTAATHTLNADHAGGTFEGFSFPKGGAATYFVDHTSPVANPSGTDIKLDYNGMPGACFSIPNGLSTADAGAIAGYTVWTLEGTAFQTLNAKMVRRKQTDYSTREALTPQLSLFGAGISAANTINTTDGQDRKLQPGDLLDLYVTIPSNFTGSLLHLIWTIYMGGVTS